MDNDVSTGAARRRRPDVEDLLLVDAEVITSDPRRPRADAFVIRRGRIVAVGDASRLGGEHPGAERRSLAGAVVVPGLHDVHNHHAMAGHAAVGQVVIPAGASVDETIRAVAAFAAESDPASGEWITGGNWGGGLMAALDDIRVRERLDRAAGGRPVLLRDASQHNRWASTAALRRSGLLGAAASHLGDAVRRAPDGTPTGVLLEGAGAAVERAMLRETPSDPDGDRVASVRAIGELNGFGITAFQDAGTSLPIMTALRSLDHDGLLTAWVVTSLLMNDPIFGADPVGEPLLRHARDHRSEHHRPDFVKIFLDGVPSARTAAFLDAYPPAGRDSGDGPRSPVPPLLPLDELVAALRAAAAQGLSAKIHCTGDAAVRRALDAVERVDEWRAAGLAAPYQIAHGQFVSPEDLPRFADLDVTADVSPPLWFPNPITQVVAGVLAPGRTDVSQPNADLVRSGARVAAGSDWPVSASPDPWSALQALVTREDPSGIFPGALAPEQALTAAQALAAYTTQAAEAMGLSGVTGAIAPGLSADFAVIDRDPTAVDPSTIGRTRVEETWFAGERVHPS